MKSLEEVIAFYKQQLEKLDKTLDPEKYILYTNEILRLQNEIDAGVKMPEDENQNIKDMIQLYEDSLVDLDPEKDAQKYAFYTNEIQRLKNILDDNVLEQEIDNIQDGPKR